MVLGQSVARAAVSSRAVVVATRTATLAAATATTEVAAVGPLRSLEQTARLTGWDRHATGRAGTGRGQPRVTRNCPGRYHVAPCRASHSLHALALVRERQREAGAFLARASRTG